MKYDPTAGTNSKGNAALDDTVGSRMEYPNNNGDLRPLRPHWCTNTGDPSRKGDEDYLTSVTVHGATGSKICSGIGQINSQHYAADLGESWQEILHDFFTTTGTNPDISISTGAKYYLHDGDDTCISGHPYRTEIWRATATDSNETRVKEELTGPCTE